MPAPYSRRTLATSTWPALAASMRGVCPFSLWSSMFAPSFSSTFTTSTKPPAHAYVNAVLPGKRRREREAAAPRRGSTCGGLRVDVRPVDQEQLDDVHVAAAGSGHERRDVPLDAPVLHVGVHGQQNLRATPRRERPAANLHGKEANPNAEPPRPGAPVPYPAEQARHSRLSPSSVCSLTLRPSSSSLRTAFTSPSEHASAKLRLKITRLLQLLPLWQTSLVEPDEPPSPRASWSQTSLVEPDEPPSPRASWSQTSLRHHEARGARRASVTTRLVEPDEPPSPRASWSQTAQASVRDMGGTYLSAWPAFSVFSALIRVRAAAASSRAQLTEDVRRRSTSGSAKALPSAVDSLPMPAEQRKGQRCTGQGKPQGHNHTSGGSKSSPANPIQG
ncbi:hypothetical protein EYF80_051830 [Liparis tanakae]|uniref:Uncharacterized protein n=1 Tax=Liparis tanakae TaxID=230148 RepID=A0A4Z2FC86_9TELE|nr:hypothetical protein EYF80_051830 [Liparis tanakae]